MLKALKRLSECVAVAALSGCGGDVDADRITITETQPFGAGFALIREIIPEQNDSALIGAVTHLAVASDGRILITDGQQGTVFLYAPDGTLERRIGRPGDGPGEFRSAFRSQVAPSGQIVVLDPLLRRIQVFDALGGLIRIVPLERYGYPNDLAVLQDDSFLLTVSDPADARVLLRIAPSGEEVWRHLPIGREVPDGEQDGPVWQGPRFYSLALRRDTAWVITTLRSTLWKVALASRSISRLEVAFPGYLPPNLPPPSAGQRSGWEWMASRHLTGLLQRGDKELYWPFIQGQPYDDGPRMLLRRNAANRWLAYNDVSHGRGIARGYPDSCSWAGRRRYACAVLRAALKRGSYATERQPTRSAATLASMNRAG